MVVLCARRTEELERIKSNLIHSKWYNNSNSPIVMPLDLSDTYSLSQIVEKIISVTGHIDILINNAGITHRGTILSTNIDIHMKVMQVNYFGTVAITNGKKTEDSKLLKFYWFTYKPERRSTFSLLEIQRNVDFVSGTITKKNNRKERERAN